MVYDDSNVRSVKRYPPDWAGPRGRLFSMDRYVFVIVNLEATHLFYGISYLKINDQDK